MALSLAPQDWQQQQKQLSTTTKNMDHQSSTNPPAPRQAPDHNNNNGHQHPPQPQMYPAHAPFPPQVSQWTPNPNAPAFYSAFTPFMPPGAPPPNPYFDPNQQLAWAYQHMMFSAQQHHQLGVLPDFHRQPSAGGPRPSPGAQPQPDFFQNGVPIMPFQSGTPPPHPNSQQGHGHGQQQQQQYQGFHPYRRPGRSASGNSTPVSDRADSAPFPQSAPGSDWSRGGSLSPHQPPYARQDAAASSNSVNSSNGSSRSGGNQHHQRTRTNSNQSGGPPNSASSTGSLRGQRPNDARSTPSRNNSAGAPAPPSGSVPRPGQPHQRGLSSSSTATSSSSSNRPSPISASASSAPSQRVPRPSKPSPLSQGQTFPVSDTASKRMSRDDSELTITETPTVQGHRPHPHGLKGRLRRALSFNAISSMEEGNEADGSVRSTKPKRAGSLFNTKLNASTDNISLSSTVSSASVMIRKLGSMGKLARRNSLMSITSLFKDKEKKNEDGSSSKKGKKADKAEATVSHATVELDRGGGSGMDDQMVGLSPAAKIVRQHTLRSNAEAAAKAKAAQAAQAAPPASSSSSGQPLPTTWERNTATRGGSDNSHHRTNRPTVLHGGVGEDGTREDDNDSDMDSDEAGGYDHQLQDEDDDLEDGDEDVTIRLGRTTLDESDEPWAVGIRRSVERTRVPVRGILKNAGTYDQDTYLEQPPPQPFARVRSNSYDNSNKLSAEPGPLARIPSPDPDHIDGLRSASPEHFTLPPLSFETTEISLSDPATASSPAKTSTIPLPETKEKAPSPAKSSTSPSAPTYASVAASNPTAASEKFAYTHPTLNSSAPALSTMFKDTGLTLNHRSATVPGQGKKLTFAANLSIYDTFSSVAYDRRSEPATCNRLTPALAQRIKEELNAYKMEEMEVHAQSRIHTHFFV